MPDCPNLKIFIWHQFPVYNIQLVSSRKSKCSSFNGMSDKLTFSLVIWGFRLTYESITARFLTDSLIPNICQVVTVGSQVETSYSFRITFQQLEFWHEWSKNELLHNGISVLDAMATHGETLIVWDTRYTCRNWRFMSYNHRWLAMHKEKDFWMN